MRFSTHQRLVSILCILLLWVTFIPAYAEKAVVSSDARIYAFPNSAAPSIQVSKGTILEVLGVRSGWACIRVNGNNGFIPLRALSAVQTKASANPSIAYACVQNARVFNANRQVIATVPLNTAVNVLGISNGICAVQRGGVSAFMLQSELSAQKTTADNRKSTPVTAYVCVAQAPVYAANKAIIGTLSLNTPVSVTAVNGAFARVSKDGKEGIMLCSNLSATQTPTKPAAAIQTQSPKVYYVLNNNAKVYNPSGKVLGVLPVNTEVTVIAFTDQLAYVTKGTAKGIMVRSDLSVAKVPVRTPNTPATVLYVAHNGARVYNASGSVIGVLPVNTPVIAGPSNGTLITVTNGSNIGFMSKADLSSSKVAVQANTVTPVAYYVKNNGAKVVNGNGKVIAQLPVNTQVWVGICKGNLAAIRSGAATGFMLLSDLSKTKVEQQLQYGAVGEAVARIQKRLKELGYFSGSIGGNYLDLTRAAVAAFQADAGLPSTGNADAATLTAMFSESAPHKKVESPAQTLETNGSSTVTAARGTAKTMDWWNSGIQSIFSRGTIATITDVQTGIAWREKRTGGTNHADCQPLTASDTAAFKRACGSWSWTRRAVFVTINGVNYAASINCMPHGSGSITTNNFNGHHCIHFTNSRTHGGNKVCPLHQAAIQKAAATTL